MRRLASATSASSVTQIPPAEMPHRLGGVSLERDARRIEHRAHVVGLVVGHVAEVEQELGHAAMIAAGCPGNENTPKSSCISAGFLEGMWMSAEANAER
jgi:hypothetical protein